MDSVIRPFYIERFTSLQAEVLTLYLPRDALVHSVVLVRNDLIIYAEVDPSATTTEPHGFHLVGTGEPITFNRGASRFLGTVTVDFGRSWHVFHTAQTQPVVANATISH